MYLCIIRINPETQHNEFYMFVAYGLCHTLDDFSIPILMTIFVCVACTLYLNIQKAIQKSLCVCVCLYDSLLVGVLFELPNKPNTSIKTEDIWLLFIQKYRSPNILCVHLVRILAIT